MLLVFSKGNKKGIFLSVDKETPSCPLTRNCRVSPCTLSLHSLCASAFWAALSFGYIVERKMVNSLLIQWHFEFWSSSIPLLQFNFRVLKLLLHTFCLSFLAVFYWRDRVECVYLIFSKTRTKTNLFCSDWN